MSRSTVLAAAAALVFAVAAPASATVHVNGTLSGTSHAPRAHGRASFQSNGSSHGRFKVVAAGLTPSSSFDLVVGGVKVATLNSNRAGVGKVRLGTAPKGHEGLLGTDPRGQTVAVREADGNDDLEGDMPNDGDQGCGTGCVACCSGDDDGEVECEVRTADDCTAHHGTVSTATSCIPNPCTPAGPPVVCCIADSSAGAFVDDDPEVECELTTSADCGEHHGTVVQGTSCDPNPCAPVPPANVVVCCVPDDDGTECEELTADHCAAVHGTTPANATSCEADPCGGSNHQGDGSD